MVSGVFYFIHWRFLKKSYFDNFFHAIFILSGGGGSCLSASVPFFDYLLQEEPNILNLKLNAFLHPKGLCRL